MRKEPWFDVLWICTGPDDAQAHRPAVLQLEFDERRKHGLTHHLSVQGLSSFNDAQSHHGIAPAIEQTLGGEGHLESPRHPSWLEQQSMIQALCTLPYLAQHALNFLLVE